MSVTIREIAAAAGVHHSTVSRALRHHPGLSEARGNDLRALAMRMGYVPDPVLGALMAYRTSRRPPAFHAVIAWLDPDRRRTDWRRHRAYRDYFACAEARARQLGFQIEEICLPGAGVGVRRLNSMLAARNISGLIVGPAPFPGLRLEHIAWQHLSAVRIGQSLQQPPLHAVTAHHGQAMLVAMRELRARGYRRPGLFLSRAMDERVGRQWTAVFLREQLELAPEDRLPPALFDDAGYSDVFINWIHSSRPDVVVAVGDRVLLPALRQAGLRTPTDIGFCTLVQSPTLPASGIEENSGQIGAAAVDFVVAMMNRRERGVPDFPQTVLISNRWIEAGTLRPRPVGGA